MIVLTVIGLGVASYLTYVHYSGIKPACTAGDSCMKVQTSVYSELAGVPVALIGLIGYIAILALAARSGKRDHAVRHAGLHARRLRLQRLPDLPRGLLDPSDLRVVRSSAVIMTILMCLACGASLRGALRRRRRRPSGGARRRGGRAARAAPLRRAANETPSATRAPSQPSGDLAVCPSDRSPHRRRGQAQRPHPTRTSGGRSARSQTSSASRVRSRRLAERPTVLTAKSRRCERSRRRRPRERRPPPTAGARSRGCSR